MNDNSAIPRFDVVQRSAFGSASSSSPLEDLKYYLFVYMDGINVGNKIEDADLEFWRTNANMDIIAVCDIPFLLSKDQPEPEWKEVIQK